MAGNFPAGPGAAGPLSGEPDLALLITYNVPAGIQWKSAIEADGPLCAIASSFDEIARWRRLHRPDLAVVDLKSPFAWPSVELLFPEGLLLIGVASDPEDRLRALDAGCCRAVGPDASPDEIARIVREQLRTSNPLTNAKGLLTIGPLVIDFARGRVLWHGEELDLSRQLFGVLALLALSPDEPVSIGELLKFVWGNSRATSDDVYHAINRLRNKLNDHGHIVTRPGFGYVFCPAEPVATIDLTEQTEQAGALAS